MSVKKVKIGSDAMNIAQSFFPRDEEKQKAAAHWIQIGINFQLLLSQKEAFKDLM